MLGTLPNRKGCLTRARRQSSPSARKTVLILFEFLIFPSPVTTRFRRPLTSCLSCVSSVCRRCFVSSSHGCSPLFLLLSLPRSVFLPVCYFESQKYQIFVCSTIDFPAAVSHVPLLASFRSAVPFFCFCTLYLLNFSLLILHCIFSSSTSPRRKNFFHTISGHL